MIIIDKLWVNSNSIQYKMINEPNETTRTKAPRRAKSARSTTEEPNNIKQIIQEIIKEDNMDNVNQDNAQEILRELKKRQVDYQNKSEYVTAEIFADAATKVKTFMDGEKFTQIQMEKIEDINEKFDFTRNVRESMEKDWSTIISNAEQQRDQELADMERDFAIELEEFDKQNDEEPNSRNVKFSPEYLNLRHRQKVLTISNNFLEAKAIKNQADELEKIEKERQLKNWYDFLDANRSEMVEKHQKLYRTRENSWDIHIRHLRKVSNKEIKQSKMSETHFFDRMKSVGEFAEIKVRATTTRSMKRANSQRFERTLDPRQKTFRQRQIMNLVTYTKVTTPRVRRSVQ
ncbi:hypothetical protein TRFO_28827 [Tritrichomonas foetus]|uniref:Uncharacterized protein n=1 Tax=Tritrichomonas foetus TaxID=1144522 RepID=A0A1J4K1S3_9EUKA|nr:hypothetical protein TRFO_28827 [Tritrichomonas foetus]|eukprot:OHT03694.1 hypothetical protein TRFO_28827 [Tritrichomonas foetus]